jgi:hypothetical protein
MIPNCAFLALITEFLLVGWLAGELRFLASQRAAIFHVYGREIVGGVLLLFFNLCALYYAVARWLFLRETGRKLTHVDRQLIAADGVHEDIPPRLWSVRS